MATSCAREQGAFWELHDRLYAYQLGLGDDVYIQLASNLGLNLPSFQECLDSERYLNEVRADFEFAANLGINSTPTFFINGIPLIGAVPLEQFKQIIDAELAGKIP